MDIYNRIRLLWNHIKAIPHKDPSDEDNSQKSQEEAPPILRAELQIPQSVIERYDAKQSDEANNKKRRERFEVITLVTGVIGLLALLATLCETRRATTALIESARSDKRAWVGIGNITVFDKLTAGKPLRIRAAITNSGESPAVHTFAVGYSTFLVRMEEDKGFFFSGDSQYASCVGPKPRWGDTPGGVIILPGANTMFIDRESPVVPEMFVKLMASDNPSKKIQVQTLTPSDIEAIRTMRTAPNLPLGTTQERVSLYIVGCVNYFDAFRAAHRTTFCFQYAYDSVERSETGGALIPCEGGGNDAD